MTELDQEPIVLVFGADKNLNMDLGVALYSTLVHLERDCLVYLYILDGGISTINKRRLLRVLNVNHVNIRLEWVESDMTSLRSLRVHPWQTHATYLRLLIPDVVEERFDKAIYLDCDILVERNLRYLWREDIGDHALLAVRGFAIPCVSSPGGIAKYKELGLRPETPYFNSGLLVLNMKRWRTEKISEKVFCYLSQYKDYLNCHDQEGLNAVLAGDWGVLNPRWNVMQTILGYEWYKATGYRKEINEMRQDLLNNAYIYHFTGPKPWQLKCKHPAKVKWRRYLEESRWFDPIKGIPITKHSTKKTPKIRKSLMIPKTKVTIAIPTYNRSHFLKDCLESVLAQDYSDFHVVVLDDGSFDDTEEAVRSFADSRITYIRNKTNTGLFNNWSRAVEVNSSPYLSILPDDDVMLPGFIRKSVMVLDKHPNAAFSAGLARYIDLNGATLHLQDAGDMADGLNDGLEYLHHIVVGPDYVMHPATVMMRSSALETVGSFQAPHAKQVLDMNLYIRMAKRFDMIFMRKYVAKVRLHPEQMRHSELDAIEGSQQLANIAEQTDAVAYLLQSARGEDLSYRGWLIERLLSMNRDRGELTGLLVPSLKLTSTEQLQIPFQQILALIPPGDSFILIDESLWETGDFADRHVLPFLERDGLHWGNPPDNETAIQEVERMRISGAGFIVFAWPAFWWFEYYARFYNHLRSNFRRVLENERLVVFDLRT